jgi:hypothetical protein
LGKRAAGCALAGNGRPMALLAKMAAMIQILISPLPGWRLSWDLFPSPAFRNQTYCFYRIDRIYRLMRKGQSMIQAPGFYQSHISRLLHRMTLTNRINANRAPA